MGLDPRTPVLVGVGQATRRHQVWPDLAGPLDLMAVAAEVAIADAGGFPPERIDALSVVNVFSWNHGDAPGLLAGRLGVDAAQRNYLEVGGNTPQEEVNRLCVSLQKGEIRAALLAGGEAGAAKKAAKKAGHRAHWPTSETPLEPRAQREPVHPSEMRHLAILPIRTYPMFETALRAAAGRSIEDHRAHIGALMAPFTEVAAANPYAWFPEARSAADLMTVSAANRMVCWPYPKSVNSILDVDQGAALLLTTVGEARAAGVAEDLWVFPWAGSDCTDIWYVTERAAYDHSPAIRTNAANVFAIAGVDADAIAAFDLYSCFPSAVQLAMEALGLEADDPRPFTVTGGLPYFGGPGNDYVTHSIASMVAHLRERPGELGLVTGVGWFVTKNSMGLYSTQPPSQPFGVNDRVADEAAVAALDHPRLEAEPVVGDVATIEAYCVPYDRDGSPVTAIVIARLGPDRRAMLSTADTAVAAAMTEREWHGTKVEVGPNVTFVPL
ncbi:MAG: acetyl-CoA acetyltransferase [Acidimicrobiia bacterium]